MLSDILVHFVLVNKLCVLYFTYIIMYLLFSFAEGWFELILLRSL
jgi:hypothetical protein